MIEIDFADIVAVPTKRVSEYEEATEEKTESFYLTDDFPGLEFEEENELEEEAPDQSGISPIEEKAPALDLISEAEAKDGAELLVSTIDLATSFLGSIAVNLKLQHKEGGKKVIKRMQAIFEKELMGEDLTKKEQSLLKRYEAYLRDKEEAKKILPFSEQEYNTLVKSATAYIKQKNIRISGGGSFWGDLLLIESMKIGEIAMM